MGSISILQPEPITCPDWERGERPGPDDLGTCSKCGTSGDLFSCAKGESLCERCAADPACKYFVRGDGHGGCKVAARFMCMEWEKVHGLRTTPHPASPAPRPAAPPGPALAPLPPVDFDLFGAPVLTPERNPIRKSSGQSRTASEQRYHPLPRSESKDAPDGQPEPFSEIAATAESLAKTGLEVRLDTGPGGPEVVLVPKRTTQDRIELTYAEGAFLRMVLDVFPSGRVIAITKPDASPDGDEELEPEAVH